MGKRERKRERERDATKGPMLAPLGRGAQEVSDYLIQRAGEPWMHDLMVNCQELVGEDVLLYRSCGKPQQGEVSYLTAESNSDAKECQKIVALPLVEKAQDEEETVRNLKALEWATGLKDAGILRSLAESLPHTVIQEQLCKYEGRDVVLAKPAAVAAKINVTKSQVVWRKDKLAGAFHEYLASLGQGESLQRLPKNSCKNFLAERCVVGKSLAGQKGCRYLARSYKAWKKDGALEKTNKHILKRKNAGYKRLEPGQRRRRQGLQGRLSKMPLVRQELYDWFVGMRYAIDWKAYNRQLRSCGKKKIIGRFPRSLLREKLKQLTEDYCRECLILGEKPDPAIGSAQWFDNWQLDYGLSMLVANRRYKVPKWVLEERLELWHLTLARLRALCEEIHGYDPEMENFDQSPYHNNETGAQNPKTLGVQGAKEVPLVEGRADCLERWTANLTTCSNKERIN